MCASILLTLVTVLGVNARANRLLENDAIRARAGSEVVSRLEKKLDDHIAETKETNRKLDALTSTTTTTTTRVTSRKPVRPPKATTTTRVAPTTTRPTTTTTKVLAPATTLPPCRFALLNICLSR